MVRYLSQNIDRVSVHPKLVGYSKNGTAKGPVIYANYGRLEDFQFLVDQGVQVNGSIALVRYGFNVRGLKIRAAEKYGCVGVLIYSDPIDDGPLNKENEGQPAESYPNGPWRTPSSVQRGSVCICFRRGVWPGHTDHSWQEKNRGLSLWPLPCDGCVRMDGWL